VWRSNHTAQASPALEHAGHHHRWKQRAGALSQEEAHVLQARGRVAASDLRVEGVGEGGSVVGEPCEGHERQRRRVEQHRSPFLRGRERRPQERHPQQHRREQHPLGTGSGGQDRRASEPPPAVAGPERQRRRHEGGKEHRFEPGGRPARQRHRRDEQPGRQRRQPQPRTRQQTPREGEDRQQHRHPAGHAERVPGLPRTGAQGQTRRNAQGPERIGEALDVLPRVVDEPVPFDEVARVAIRDVGVVDLGLERTRVPQEDGDCGEEGSVGGDRRPGAGHGSPVHP
jgi:hypothetical protein